MHAETGNIGLGMNPGNIYSLDVYRGMKINGSAQNGNPLYIEGFGSSTRYGTITLPNLASSSSVHFRTFAATPTGTPGIYLGDSDQAVIYGVDQNHNDVWNIDQDGIFSGQAKSAITASFATNFTASGNITASTLETSDIYLHH